MGIIDDEYDINEHKQAARNGLGIARETISSKKFETVILDEINYALKLKLIASLFF